MVELDGLDGFEWDESNRDKNWVAHQVSVGECEEVFFNLPILVQSDPVHSQTEARHYVLGQTNTGRRLFIAFTVRNNKIRVISARDMSKKERTIYAKENP
jgi:uncharacterized DUF497 family protein